jgi:aspartate-semialdehyde dehydrogenase
MTDVTSDDDNDGNDDKVSLSKLAQKVGVQAAAKKRQVDLVRKPQRIAVIGATGLVGQELLSILSERRFPISSIRAFASPQSVGTEVDCGDETIVCEAIEAADFRHVDVAFFAGPSELAKQWVPRAAAAGAWCIDKSSAFRASDQATLAIPGVNDDDISAAVKQRQRIFAVPNCSTIQLVQALAPLHKRASLQRITVCTYQAVSGAGRGAFNELEEQVRAMFNMQDPVISNFDQRIAFNVLPRIPSLEPIGADGVTGEERKMIDETRRLLGLPALKVSVTCVRVPVFNGHSEAVHAEFDKPITPQDARALWMDAANVLVVDDANRGFYPTVEDATGEDMTLIGRVRQDTGVDDGRGLAMWVVSDNLRTGASLTAVRLAERLCAQEPS